MAMPKPVSRKLQQALGDDAGGVMVEWLEELEETNRGTRGELIELRTSITELRQELRPSITELRQELRTSFADLRQEMRLGFAAVNARIDTLAERTEKDIAKVGERSAQQLADTLKWVVPVWIASLGTVMGFMTWLTRGLR
jgi:hypothetical protein